MGNPDIARRKLSIHLERKTIEVEQLAQKLNGYCYATKTDEHGLHQSFLFCQQATASEFFKAVFLYPEVISVGSEPFR